MFIFVYGYSIVPALFIEKIILSPLSCHYSFVQNSDVHVGCIGIFFFPASPMACGSSQVKESNWSHSSNNTKSLTHCTTGQLCNGIFFFFFFFLRAACPSIWKIPGVELELQLQLPVFTKATATRDPSWVCDLHHSSWQHRILNPLNGARNQTQIIMDTSWFPYHHIGI